MSGLSAQLTDLKIGLMNENKALKIGLESKLDLMEYKTTGNTLAL